MSKILIIDDTPQYLQLMSTILAARGHVVMTHSLPDGALEAIKMVVPDLLILDWQLGDASARDILAQLDREEVTCHLKVLLCTAAYFDERSESSPREDRYGTQVIPKPFDLEAFVDKVDQMLALPAGGRDCA